ncbi:hypothetical protein EDF73_106258 [Raoultella sp. BIGb0138]|nr:hypothetical protein EDF73_106258 [Raoultella sp. BIGb0138]
MHSTNTRHTSEWHGRGRRITRSWNPAPAMRDSDGGEVRKASCLSLPCRYNPNYFGYGTFNKRIYRC